MESNSNLKPNSINELTFKKIYRGMRDDFITKVIDRRGEMGDKKKFYKYTINLNENAEDLDIHLYIQKPDVEGFENPIIKILGDEGDSGSNLNFSIEENVDYDNRIENREISDLKELHFVNRTSNPTILLIDYKGETFYCSFNFRDSSHSEFCDGYFWSKFLAKTELFSVIDSLVKRDFGFYPSPVSQITKSLSMYNSKKNSVKLGQLDNHSKIYEKLELQCNKKYLMRDEDFNFLSGYISLDRYSLKIRFGSKSITFTKILNLIKRFYDDYSINEDKLSGDSKSNYEKIMEKLIFTKNVRNKREKEKLENGILKTMTETLKNEANSKLGISESNIWDYIIYSSMQMNNEYFIEIDDIDDIKLSLGNEKEYMLDNIEEKGSVLTKKLRKKIMGDSSKIFKMADLKNIIVWYKTNSGTNYSSAGWSQMGSFYKSIYTMVELKDRQNGKKNLYYLSDGKFYYIPTNYIERERNKFDEWVNISEKLDEVVEIKEQINKQISTTYITPNENIEEKAREILLSLKNYNTDSKNKSIFQNLDQKFVTAKLVAGTKFEFCDIVNLNTNSIFHLKKYDESKGREYVIVQALRTSRYVNFYKNDLDLDFSIKNHEAEKTIKAILKSENEIKHFIQIIKDKNQEFNLTMSNILNALEWKRYLELNTNHKAYLHYIDFDIPNKRQ